MTQTTASGRIILPPLVTLGEITRAAMRARGHAVPFEPEPKIPPHDEDDLRFFWKEETNSGRGGGSSFDAMVDRVALFAGRSVPCTLCGGESELAQPEVKDERGNVVREFRVIREARGGTGFVTGSDDFRRWLDQGERARLPRGHAQVRDWIDKNGAWLKKHSMGDIACPRCCSEKLPFHTPGWLPRQINYHGRKPTVEITAEIFSQSTYHVGGSNSLARLGKVQRRLDRVRKRSEISRAGLELYYSPDGGSDFALWELTEAGENMLSDPERKTAPGVYFRSLRMAQEYNQHGKRSAEFIAADRQAAQVRRDMARDWNATR